MRLTLALVFGLIAGGFFSVGVSAEAAQHRATRLGNPATRFAPPIVTADDLRARFRDPQLRPDFAAVLQQWGWTGNLEDLFTAAETQEISEIQVPVGYTMPFMSSRERGAAICLRDVVWAGAQPYPAFEFFFTSNGRRYRCITPKACSNFFLEDLGADLRRGLTLNCHVPDKALIGQKVKACFTVSNTGNVAESRLKIELPIPKGLQLFEATENGDLGEERVRWEIPNLAPNSDARVCVVFTSREPGDFSLRPAVNGDGAIAAHCSCGTKFVGIPAILLETEDDPDPIQLGESTTYTIRVTNQGSADGTQIRLVCQLPEGQEFISASGATSVQAVGGVVTMEALPLLPPKAVATWQVAVKGVKAGDLRFKVELSSDQFEKPISREESTHQY
ncbi:MAG: DUF11 domain-containing protein [Verrucomicrobiae bacterium]|nr:DUF11 domain-containing protein [Verrucomicrobiae bacterium]